MWPARLAGVPRSGDLVALVDCLPDVDKHAIVPHMPVHPERAIVMFDDEVVANSWVARGLGVESLGRAGFVQVIYDAGASRQNRAVFCVHEVIRIGREARQVSQGMYY